MDGVDIVNNRITNKPLTINVLDGRKVKSTHICDITIPGLPMVLMGHIVPHFAIASHIGIRLLCNAGCAVTFDKDKCNVIYNGNVVLRGFKDMATNLQMLLINRLDMQTALPRSAPQFDCALHDTLAQLHPGVNLASFTHSVKTRANGISFAHQSLCNPKILTLLKAVQKGFLKGCLNLSKKLILKYLNPSPATAKGHMKWPRHGIKSTHPKTTALVTLLLQIVPPPVWMQLSNDLVPLAIPAPNVIGNNCNESIANVFCFGAFADRQSGVVYNDLMGNFPFVSFDGSVCFFVMYHYEAHAIMATPIARLDDQSIFNAYKANFNELAQKGFKPKLNIMDNQATKHIKQFLTEEECKLQLVEPHNHCINTAERAIQTFKDAFISALTTTDRDFPLQLWDKSMPQVINTLNMLRASGINPTKLAYKVLYRPYDWNRYPLTPLGCKAVVYKDRDTRGLWTLHGVDGWYLGLSMDHYRCDLNYIPETRGY